MRLPGGDPARVRQALAEIEEKLAGLGTLKIPQLDSGLFAAAGGQGAEGVSGYQNAWIRDNVMVACSRWHCGDARSALRTVEVLETFLMSQDRRMRELIKRPEAKEDVQNRPHVRFKADTLEEIADPWSHAQNDALGELLWLRLVLADEQSLNPDELELLGTLARYLGAIEYWNDRDSGPWEEERKVNCSSVGAVLAALRAVKSYLEKTGSFRMLRGPELDSWIENGQETLARQLPFESPPSRKTDAALLFLLHPLQVTGDLRIVSLVRARLRGEYGIRRYVGDSYFCQDYDEWFPPGEQTADFSQAIDVRNELLSPGCEAQWCLFDPVLSVIYGRCFRKNPAEAGHFNAQVRHFNRALEQLTPEGQCAELYYLKGTRWIPNKHTPLAWTQGNLAMALHDLKRNLALLRS